MWRAIIVHVELYPNMRAYVYENAIFWEGLSSAADPKGIHACGETTTKASAPLWWKSSP